MTGNVQRCADVIDRLTAALRSGDDVPAEDRQHVATCLECERRPARLPDSSKTSSRRTVRRTETMNASRASRARRMPCSERGDGVASRSPRSAPSRC